MKKAVEKEMRESCMGCKHVLLVKWRNVHGRGSICQMCGAQLDEEGKFVKISEATLEEATQRALTKAAREAEVSEGAERAPAMRSSTRCLDARASTKQCQRHDTAGGDESRRGAGEDDRDWHDVQLPEVEMDDVAELEKTIDATVKKLMDLKASFSEAHVMKKKGTQQHEQARAHEALREAKLAHNAVERAWLATMPRPVS